MMKHQGAVCTNVNKVAMLLESFSSTVKLCFRISVTSGNLIATCIDFILHYCFSRCEAHDGVKCVQIENELCATTQMPTTSFITSTPKTATTKTTPTKSVRTPAESTILYSTTAFPKSTRFMYTTPYSDFWRSTQPVFNTTSRYISVYPTTGFTTLSSMLIEYKFFLP